MYQNWMVKEIKSDRTLKHVTKVLKDNRIHYYWNETDRIMRVNVGTARKSTKRFDVCDELGFKKGEF